MINYVTKNSAKYTACQKTGWNWPSGSESEDGNVKILRRQQQQQRQRRRTTDKLWSEKLTWATGSGELNKTQTVQAHTYTQLIECFDSESGYLPYIISAMCNDCIFL